MGSEIQAERDVVRGRAEQWLARNGYELAAQGSTLVAEKRALSEGAGLSELAVLSVAHKDARRPLLSRSDESAPGVESVTNTITLGRR